jgi:hypothetical protein
VPKLKTNSFLHVTKSMDFKKCNLPIVHFPAPKINIYENAVILGKLGKIKDKNVIQEDFRKGIETIVVVTCDFYNIYYHWLFDLLPKFKVLQQSIKKYDAIYIPKPESQFQKDTLNKLNFKKPIIFAKEETQVFAKKVIVIGKLSIDTVPPPWIYEFIRDIFKTKLIQGYERIYISRKYAKNRRVLNEFELNAFFRRYNIRIVYLEKLSTSEQANIFFSAKLIIAPHGSALTNLVFSSPNTKVLELKGPRCGETCFARLANWSHLNYISTDCPTLAHRSYFNKIQSLFNEAKNCWDFEVRPSQIKRIILNFPKSIASID